MKFILIIYMIVGILMALAVIPWIIRQNTNTKIFIISVISLIFLIFFWPMGVIGVYFDKKRGKQK